MAQLADLPREVHELIIQELLGGDMFVVRLADFKDLADASRYWQGLAWKVYWENFHLQAKELYPVACKVKWVKWCTPVEMPLESDAGIQEMAHVDTVDELSEDMEMAEVASWIKML